MADNDVIATISGAALSLLFYENACNNGDQMGFLLGDVVMFITKNVTDSERHVESMRQHIEITSVLACSTSGQLYDECGKLHKEKLKTFVQDRSKEVVGWFRFRQNNRTALTFRDKILHKELAKYFNECNNMQNKKHFLACVLNATRSETMGTHNLRHVLLRYEDGTYRPVPLRINNLGNDSTRQDGSDYIPTPATRISQESDVFTHLVRSLKLDMRHKSGTEIVTTIQKAAEHHVKSLIPIVCESDREISEMEKQLHDLRLKIINRVIAPKRFPIDNQCIDESLETSRMEGDGNLHGTETNEVTPPKPLNAYSDHYTEKESLLPKTKGISRPTNKVCTIRGANESAQRSPSSRISNSQSSRMSTDSEDMFEVTDCL